jgi:hypothetical protein
MAKKVIAGLKKATGVVKIIRPVKSSKTGKYRYKEEIIPKDEMPEVLKNR